MARTFPLVGRISSKATRRCEVALALMAYGAFGAGEAMGASSNWLASPVDGVWSNPANWSGGVVPGNTTGADTTDGASFPNASTITTITGIDAGRTLFSMSVGAAAYEIGTVGGEAITLVSNGTGSGPRIQINGAGAGNSVPVIINAPLNWMAGGHVQNDLTRPLTFNGDMTAAGNVSMLNSSGTITYNGSMSGAGRYYGNGGSATGWAILNNVNTVAGGISLDVTRITYELAHAGAITNAPITGGRGGNFVISAENGLTGTGSISANATYVGGLSPTNAVYESIVRIDADNDYTGNTTVRGAAVALDRVGLDSPMNGALWVNNGHASPGSATGSGDVLLDGALLAGDGRIVNSGTGKGVTVTNRSTAVATGVNGIAQGRLSPGQVDGAIGTLTMSLGAKGLNISGAVAPVDTGALIFDLSTPVSSDQVQLLDSTVLNIGNGVLEFDDFVFAGSPAGGVYTLFDSAAAITGSLGSSVTGDIGGRTATLSLGDGGQDILLTVVAVPEPSVATVMGITAMAVMARRRRI